MATRKFKRKPEVIHVLEVLASNKNEQANFLPSGYLEQTEWSIDREGNVKAIIINGNCHKVGSLLVKRGTNSVTVNTLNELLVDFEEVP